MAEIDLEAVRNDATEKYNALIDNLESQISDDGHLHITPEEFAQAVNDSGLKEVFGADQADNVSMFVSEGGLYSDGSRYDGKFVIEIGNIPYGSENYSDDDGNARITITDERLNELRVDVNAEADRVDRDAYTSVADGKAESMTEYRAETRLDTMQDDVRERTVDVIRPEDSNMVIIHDTERDYDWGSHNTFHSLGIDDNLSLVTSEGSEGSFGIDYGSDESITEETVDELKENEPTSIDSHEILLYFTNDDEDTAEMTVSIDGQEMFTEEVDGPLYLAGGEAYIDIDVQGKNDEPFDVREFAEFCEDNSDAIDAAVERGESFESYDDFKNQISMESTDHLNDVDKDEEQDADIDATDLADLEDSMDFDSIIDGSLDEYKEQEESEQDVETKPQDNDVEQEKDSSAVPDDNDGKESPVDNDSELDKADADEQDDNDDNNDWNDGWGGDGVD